MSMDRLAAAIETRLASLQERLEIHHAELAAAMATTQNTIRIRGDRPIAGLPMAWAGPGRLTGWTLHNPSTTVTAVVVFRDSRDRNGDPIAHALVAPGDVASFSHPAGIAFGYGLFIDVVDGAVDPVVWIGAET